MAEGATSGLSGLRIQRLKMIVVLPLILLGVALGVMLIASNNGDLTPAGSMLDSQGPVALGITSTTAGGKLEASSTTSTNSTHKPTMKELMQSKVKECARTITGDDTPRKLEPEVRKKVLDCASEVMPDMDTNVLLKASADQLRSAAKNSGDLPEAEKIIASVQQVTKQNHACE
jgi:hypothetical protein